MLDKRKINHYFDLIIVLTQKEMKVRYKNSFLGYVWSIAQPLAFAFVFFVAFKVVMRIQMEDYALFLICGLFPWQSLANSIGMSPSIFIANSSLLKKLSFPRDILVAVTILQDLIHFILSIPVILFFMYLYHRTPSLMWFLGIPVLLIIQFFITFGICLFLSSVNIFFRDLERLTAIIITFVFYFTPIIYPERLIPEKYHHLLNFNPFAPLMVSWRNLFLEGTLNPVHLALSLAYGLVFLMIGYASYKKLSWKFAEVL